MILIAIPVLNRPERAAPLFENIKATTGIEHEVCFICSTGDEAEIEAVAKTPADLLIAPWRPGPGDWARKLNLAYRWCEEPYMLLGADDLLFHEGWAEAALDCAYMSGAGVIGTNDLGNPRVIAGRHSTHPLVRRSYIEEHGTFDEPGKILHEGYDHQFCDDELVETAKARGQWKFCTHARVEHLHPYFGKGEMDDTYVKALAETKADSALFLRRRAMIRKRRVR